MAGVVGEPLDFGVADDEASLTTQRVNMNTKTDMKSARDKNGTEIAISFYNTTQDINIEGLGATTSTPGSVLSLTSPPQTLVGGCYILEAGVDTGNEDFVKSSICPACSSKPAAKLRMP